MQESAQNIDPLADRLALAVSLLLPKIILRELEQETTCRQPTPQQAP